MLDFVVRVVGVLVAFLVAPLLVGQAEHKVMAHMQSRLGPMYAGGFHGWAQLVADGVKFVQKESVTPAAADKAVFEWAPVVAILPYMAVLAAIPLAPGIVGADLGSGLFFVLAVMSIGVLGSLMAGWASGNKYSLLGGLRVAAQLMSYELPFVLSAASVAVAAGSLSLSGIAAAWNPWCCSGSCPDSWCSSSRASPSSSGLRSTCRWLIPKSSSGHTPSTRACGSPCSCSPSTPGSWCWPV